MNKQTLHIGDTVYIPAEDPKCNTIYTVENVRGGAIKLYHPIKGKREVTYLEIQEPLF
jgi:hypothetical protein